MLYAPSSEFGGGIFSSGALDTPSKCLADQPLRPACVARSSGDSSWPLSLESSSFSSTDRWDGRSSLKPPKKLAAGGFGMKRAGLVTLGARPTSLAWALAPVLVLSSRLVVESARLINDPWLSLSEGPASLICSNPATEVAVSVDSTD